MKLLRNITGYPMEDKLILVYMTLRPLREVGPSTNFTYHRNRQKRVCNCTSTILNLILILNGGDGDSNDPPTPENGTYFIDSNQTGDVLEPSSDDYTKESKMLFPLPEAIINSATNATPSTNTFNSISVPPFYCSTGKVD